MVETFNKTNKLKEKKIKKKKKNKGIGVECRDASK